MDNKHTYNERTPGQWNYISGEVLSDNGDIIARAYRERDCNIPAYQRDNNLKFIVKAVNNHDALVEALKRFLESSACTNHCKPNDMTCDTNFARKVLANIEREK